METTTPRKPAHVVRVGLIKVAIWENDGQHGKYYTSTPERRYQDTQTKKWKSTTSFKYDDLLTLAKALDMAHSWITEQRQAKGSEQPPADTDLL